jgi:hypothetical protein
MIAPCAPPRVHRGQALAEFLVVGLVLASFFLIVPLIGKYQDLSHATLMASRYVAWETTVRHEDAVGGYKSQDQLAQEVRRRFFSRSDAPIRTYEAYADSAAERNPLWTDHANQPLFTRLTDVGVFFGPAAGSQPAGGFSAVAATSTPFQPPAGQFVSGLGLNDHGIFTGVVRVRLAQVTGLPEFDNLVFTQHTSLVPNPWTGRSPAEVEGRFSRPALFPLAALAGGLSAVTSVVPTIEMGQVPAPRLGQVDFWRDMVPEDRLR